MQFFRYPWQVGFDDLSVKDAASLPVASGGCCLIQKGAPFKYPFPGRSLFIGGKAFCSYELPDTDFTGRISQYSHEEGKLYAARGAHKGLFPDEKNTSSDLSEMVQESLRYIQRIEEIIEEKSQGFGQRFKRVDWGVVLHDLSHTEWKDGLIRKPLIVDLAEKQYFPLKEIYRGAKRILRRERDTERLSKAREFDKASLIRIAQLPGRTISEKAGPKQRIPAVKRYETTDTLENRVVEHFCRLAEIEWRRNQADERTALSDERKPLATGFVGLCKRVRHSDDFGLVQKLESPCVAPNYTLEQNTNYRAIWQGYRKLIRRQTEREECWAWARRLFLNRAYMFVAELYRMLFTDKETVHAPYRKHLRARLAHQYGLWIEPESLPGPRVLNWEDRGTSTSYLLSPQDLLAGFEPLPDLLRLNADCYIALVDKSMISICPAYAFVGSEERESCREAKGDLAWTYDRILSSWKKGAGEVRLAKPLFLWSDFLGDKGLDERDRDGVYQVGIPVICNDEWFSPGQELVDSLKGGLMG